MTHKALVTPEAGPVTASPDCLLIVHLYATAAAAAALPVELKGRRRVTPCLEVRAVIKGDQTRFRLLVDELLQFFAETYKEVFAFEHPPLHDPCAVAYVLAPNIFRVRELRVDVETKSELGAGQTVCDVWRQGQPHVARHVIQRVLEPSFLASYDVASTVCQALCGGRAGSPPTAAWRRRWTSAPSGS